MADNWPGTPFEESMLEHGGAIIHCPDKDLAKELFRIFTENGMCWYGDEDMDDTRWENYRENTCYRVTAQRAIKYGSTMFYLSSLEYDSHIKCTYYGGFEDFEPADYSEMVALFER